MAYTTIDDPTIHFTAFLRNSIYGGSDTSYDIGFQPDWIWDKVRSTTGVHALFDSVRGVGSSGKVIYTNNNNAEGTNALIKSIDTNGFTITASSDHSSQTIVDWCWKAGGSASSNSNGSITSNVSANTTAGFSIATYTGTGSNANVGHGLTSAPELIITKSRGSTTDWKVHTSAFDSSWDVGNLNDASAFGNSSYTASTNSIFYVGSGSPTNASSINYVSYLFHSVKGYSKIGSYTGNANANGTFVYTGFKTAWILLKYNATSNWIMFDNKRSSFNVVDDFFYANETDAEGTGSSTVRCDFVSNGFKIRGTANAVNGSSNKLIYMAFAESPFVNSSGIPCNAR